MSSMIRSITLAAALVASLPTFSSAEDAHHPSDAVTQPTAPAAPARSGVGPLSAPTPQMPAGGMPMMTMMMSMMGKGMQGMSDMAMPGMEMADRVEGRIAFLRAELKITEAQTKAWNDFAQALRENGKKLGETRSMMMGMSPQGSAQPPTLVQRLEQQERWYAARLGGIQAIKTALTNLYGTLADDQKKAADELMVPHLGLMPMGMAAN